MLKQKGKGSLDGPFRSQSAHDKKDGRERPVALLARRASTIKRRSLDARTVKGSLGHSSKEKYREFGGPSKDTRRGSSTPPLREQVEEQSAHEGHCEVAQKLTPLHPSKNGGGGEI
jgi:hypothetical protein